MLRKLGILAINIFLLIGNLEALEKPNKGIKLYGVGLCLIKEICLVSHDEFMFLQLGIIHGRSPGDTLFQFSSVYSESYGNNFIQAGIFNINRPKSGYSGNNSFFQFGGLNIVREGNIFGGQFSIAANNLPSKESETGLPYTKLSPNFKGLQLSGGMNTSKTGIGFQIGFDLHWIVFIFDSERQRYISRAKSIYGIQFHPIAQQIEQDLVGIQVSFLNASNSSRGFQIGGKNESVDLIGVQGGFVNKTARDTYGLQIGLTNSTKQSLGIQAGAFNDSESITGIQYGLFNSSKDAYGLEYGLWNSIDSEFVGLQFGAINSDSLDSTIYGAQIGYLYNKAGRVMGPQLGFYNLINDCDFVQMGAINIANRNVKGAQIGLYNSTDGKASFQIGLLNHAEKNTLKWFPFVNIDIE